MERREPRKGEKKEKKSKALYYKKKVCVPWLPPPSPPLKTKTISCNSKKAEQEDKAKERAEGGGLQSSGVVIWGEGSHLVAPDKPPLQRKHKDSPEENLVRNLDLSWPRHPLTARVSGKGPRGARKPKRSWQVLSLSD